jgi:hypothetical protein
MPYTVKELEIFLSASSCFHTTDCVLHELELNDLYMKEVALDDMEHFWIKQKLDRWEFSACVFSQHSLCNEQQRDKLAANPKLIMLPNGG